MLLASKFINSNFLTILIHQKLAATTDIKWKAYVFLRAASASFKIKLAFKSKYNLVLVSMLTSIRDAGIMYW